MKQQQRINPSRELDMQALGDRIQTMVNETLATILPGRQAEFDQRFIRDGDMAYGALNNALFKEVRAMLTGMGLKAEPRLPGNFEESREWGNADETHQQRWMWSLIIGDSGEVIGAVAVGSHHDHSRFKVPVPPEVIGLAATTHTAVIDELGKRMPQFAEAQSFTLWYADYLKRTEDAASAV